MYLFGSAIDTVDILYKVDILLLEGANIFVEHVLQGEHFFESSFQLQRLGLLSPAWTGW